AGRGVEVAVADDGRGGPAVGGAQPGAGLHQRAVEGSGRLGGGVGPLVLDADGDVVVVGHVRADHVVAGPDGRQRGVAALHDVAAAADGELLPGVGPPVAVHVEVLDGAGEGEGVFERVVGAVGGRGVVDDDVGGGPAELGRAAGRREGRGA